MTKSKTGYFYFLLVLSIIFIFSNAVYAGSEKSFHDSVTVASGPMGGPWYSSWVKIAEVLMREIPGLTVNVMEGGGISNIRLVNEGVNAQMGMTSSYLLGDAKNGNPPFEQKCNNFSCVGAIVTSLIQVLVPAKSDINDFNDLSDKNLAPGVRGFSSEYLLRNMLEAYGVTYDGIKENGGKINYVSWGEYPNLMGDGHIDAACLCGQVPHPIVMQLETKVPVRLLEMGDEERGKLLNKLPNLFTVEVPAEAYKGLEEAVKCLAYSGIFIVNNELPDDFIQKVFEVLMDNKEEIVEELPFIDLISWEKVQSGLTEDDIHPAVLRIIKANTD